jgi:hypothetical protein
MTTTEIITMAVKDLKPASYNPRRIDDASLAALDETEERALNFALNSPKLAGEFSGRLQELLDEIRGPDAQIFHELPLDEPATDITAKTYLRDPDEAPAAPGLRHARRRPLRAWAARTALRRLHLRRRDLARIEKQRTDGRSREVLYAKPCAESAKSSGRPLSEDLIAHSALTAQVRRAPEDVIAW